MSWAAVGATAASVTEMMQGLLSILASLVSVMWLSIQIYSWFEKRVAARKNKGDTVSGVSRR